MINQDVVSAVTFPLRGPLADISIGLEFLIVFIGLQTFAMLFFKFISTKDRIREVRNFTWGIFGLTMAITFAFYIQSDFIAETQTARDMIVGGGYIALSLGAMVLILISAILDKNVKNPITYLGSALIVIVIIAALFRARELVTILAIIGAFPIMFAYMVQYARSLLHIAHASRELKMQIGRFLLSFGFIGVGYLMNGDFFMIHWGLTPRIISDLLMIAGLLLFRYSLQHLPLLTEFDWEQKIQAVLVVHDIGIPIFSRFFQKSEEVNDDMLVSGAISSVKTLLGATLSSDRPRSVKVGDKTFLFEYRSHAIFVIIADAPIKTLQTRLVDFANEFMSHYGNTIASKWDGKTDAFGGIEWLADKIFFPV